MILFSFVRFSQKPRVRFVKFGGNMFKENFIRLCNERGESPSSVCKKVNITPATFSGWDSNSVPRQATLLRIADYFGVTVESLTADTTKTKALTFNESFTESEKELVVAYRKHPEMHEAIKTILGIRKEEVAVREIFEIKFWEAFVSWCDFFDIKVDDAINELNIAADKLKALYTSNSTSDYLELKKVVAYFNKKRGDCSYISIDSFLGIDVGDINNADYAFAKRKLYAAKITFDDTKITNVFPNINTYISGLRDDRTYWDGNFIGLAYIANCSINELVGRPRPLDSEGVYNNRNVAAYETNRDKSADNNDSNRNVK